MHYEIITKEKWTPSEQKHSLGSLCLELCSVVLHKWRMFFFASLVYNVLFIKREIEFYRHIKIRAVGEDLYGRKNMGSSFINDFSKTH